MEGAWLEALALVSACMRAPRQRHLLFCKRPVANVLSAPLFFTLSRTNKAQLKATRLLRGLRLPNIRALDNSTMQKQKRFEVRPFLRMARCWLRAQHAPTHPQPHSRNGEHLSQFKKLKPILCNTFAFHTVGAWLEALPLETPHCGRMAGSSCSVAHKLLNSQNALRDSRRPQ